MYYPTLDEVRKLSKHGNLVPIRREIVADLETPVSAYLKVAQGSYSFLLESVEGGERLARYSFIGSDPYLVLKVKGEERLDPLLGVERELGKYKLVPVPGLPRFHGGAVGHFGFNGECSFAIPIRSLFVSGEDAYAQTGGGIVYDSTAENEYQELSNKLAAMQKVLSSFEKKKI